MERVTDDSATRFLSLASHELRGPLGTVHTYAALLASPRFALDERVRSAVEVMLRNVDRALGSWEFLVEAWRLDAGGLKLDLRDEDLLPLLRASVESATGLAREHGVRLEVSLPDELPRAAIDPDRLSLALSGAWSHVLARSSPGSSAGLTARALPEACELIFWDPGPPLTPEGEAHVFDRRWLATRGHELGSAFRMAMAGALVRAHGGRAEVGSNNGRTRFHLVLPAARQGPTPSPG